MTVGDLDTAIGQKLKQTLKRFPQISEEESEQLRNKVKAQFLGDPTKVKEITGEDIVKAAQAFNSFMGFLGELFIKNPYMELVDLIEKIPVPFTEKK